MSLSPEGDSPNLRGLNPNQPNYSKEAEIEGAQLARSAIELRQLQGWIKELTMPYRLAFHLAIDEHTKSSFPTKSSRWNPFNRDKFIAWETETKEFPEQHLRQKISYSGSPPDEQLKSATIQISEQDKGPASFGFNFSASSSSPFDSVELQIGLDRENMADQIYNLNNVLILKTGRIDWAKPIDPEFNKDIDLAEFCYQHFSFGRRSKAGVIISLKENPYVSAYVERYPHGTSDEHPLAIKYNYEIKRNALVRNYSFPWLSEEHIDRSYLNFCTNTMSLDQYKRLIISFFNMVPIEPTLKKS